MLLPAPFGPTSPTTRPLGIDSVQSVRAALRPYVLPEADGGQDRGHATPACTGGPKRVPEEGLDAVVVEAGPTSLVQPPVQVGAQGAVRGQRGVAQRPDDERADTGAGSDQALVLELAVGLEDRVRVDREVAHDLFDRRQLVALAQEAEPEGLPDLLDDLQVGRDAGARIEMELDHRGLHSTRSLDKYRPGDRSRQEPVAVRRHSTTTPAGSRRSCGQPGTLVGLLLALDRPSRARRRGIAGSTTCAWAGWHRARRRRLRAARVGRLRTRSDSTA